MDESLAKLHSILDYKAYIWLFSVTRFTLNNFSCYYVFKTIIITTKEQEKKRKRLSTLESWGHRMEQRCKEKALKRSGNESWFSSDRSCFLWKPQPVLDSLSDPAIGGFQ